MGFESAYKNAMENPDIGIESPVKDAPRKYKYGNVKTVVDGITFDSKAEASRWVELQTMQKSRLIFDLRRQVRFILVEGFTHMGERIRPISYIADFAYTEKGRSIVEDVKGGKATATESFNIKRKLFMRMHPDVVFRTTGNPGRPKRSSARKGG